MNIWELQVTVNGEKTFSINSDGQCFNVDSEALDALARIVG